METNWWDVLVAVGTLALAGATVYSVYQGRKQIQSLSKQLNLQIGRQIPHLVVKKVVFKGDSIELDIENPTDVPAFWVGLATSFYLVDNRYFDAQMNGQAITGEQAAKMMGEGKTVYHKYYLPLPDMWPKLIYNGEDVKPSSAVCFFQPRGISEYFPAKSTARVNTTPRFAISGGDKKELHWWGKGFRFNEFRDFLIKNNINTVAVSMHLVCKDAADTSVGQGDISNFAILTASDKSLTDSSKHAQHFDFLPVSPLDFITDEYWTSEEEYRNTYSSWHVFD